jgi:hypothetical protein
MQVVDPRPPGPSIASFMLELLIIGTIIAAAVYLIHRHDKSRPEEVQEVEGPRIKPWMITTIMFILAFFGPISLNIYPEIGPFDSGRIYIFSMTYQILSLYTLDIVVFDLSIVMATLLLSFMRPVFVYQLSRYYKGKTTRGRTIVVGIISELQLTLITGLVMLGSSMAIEYMIAVPIPILLLLGIVSMWLVPVPELAVPWKELDGPKAWWEEEPEVASDVIFEEN